MGIVSGRKLLLPVLRKYRREQKSDFSLERELETTEKQDGNPAACSGIFCPGYRFVLFPLRSSAELFVFEAVYLLQVFEVGALVSS